jgi:hypothetical protein
MTGSAPPEFSCSTPLDDGPVVRTIIPDLEADLGHAHCLLLIGPYEVGKSHVAQIARRFGSGASVFVGSDPHHRTFLAGTASLLRGSRGKLVVIDEVHAAPEALDTIRLELESWTRERVPVGQFLLLSSRSLEAATLVASQLGSGSAFARSLRLVWPISHHWVHAYGRPRTYSWRPISPIRSQLPNPAW